MPGTFLSIEDPETIARKMAQKMNFSEELTETALYKVRQAARLYQEVNPDSMGKLSRQVIAAIMASIPTYNTDYET